MNNSLTNYYIVSTSENSNVGGEWNILSYFLLVVVGINSVGVIANGILVTGFVLMRGFGQNSSACFQMLLQQATVDFLTCALVIA